MGGFETKRTIDVLRGNLSLNVALTGKGLTLPGLDLGLHSRPSLPICLNR